MNRSPQALTDERLAQLVATTKDRAAFGELVRRQHSRIRGLLRHLCRDGPLADDLAQQTFLRAWEKLASFQGATHSRFGAWLASIAYREFLQRARRGKLEARLFDGESDVELVQAAPETPSVVSVQIPEPEGGAAYESTPPISELLGHCNRHQAQALYMNYVLELTHDEIAHITDVPLGTVKSHIARGKKAIKARLMAAEGRGAIAGVATETENAR